MTHCTHRATLHRMTRRMTGSNNPNWKGGRSVASNGYIIVRVGREHHLSDVRGYAYEHRVVAERTIGRRLKKGEIVHHVDGDRKNNDPSNLEVHPSIAHHFVAHRTSGRWRRLPGESNDQVDCECGCGQAFAKFDKWGRGRRYIPGHNTGTR